MKKNYIFNFLLFIGISAFAQVETFTFSGYDGTAQTLIASTATVNDQITITFEDTDIINNFYTENQTFIHMFGGLDTSTGGFQGSPMFSDLSSQPMLLLTDGDATNGPNTYSITINLTEQYSSVPDGTQIFGFNLLFQNQFSGGGNNQTLDLYIDLVDANKDSSTLSASDFLNEEPSLKHYVSNNNLYINSNSQIKTISIYNLLGQNVISNSYNNTNAVSLDLNSKKAGIYILKVETNNNSKTLKFLLN